MSADPTRFDGLPKKVLERRGGRSGGKHQGWGAAREKLLHFRAHGLAFAVVVQYEAHGVRVWWPIGLNRSKPLGEKPNRQLRRVNIVSHDAVDSRQAETASKGIDRRIQNAIDPQLVYEPEHSLLDEAGHTRVHRQASLAPAIHQAANHRRLQVH